MTAEFKFESLNRTHLHECALLNYGKTFFPNAPYYNLSFNSYLNIIF